MPRSIEDLELCSRLQQGISKMDITKLTHIQDKSWDALRKPDPSDIIIHSETGSGKTLSYLLPVMENLLRDSMRKREAEKSTMNGSLSRKDGTSVLIIVPVRELAQQTLTVCKNLLRYIPFLTCGLLMGGEKRVREKERLRKGQNILIATPGRLLDHIRSTQRMNLGNLQYVVIDEADRTLDEGFEKDLRELKVYLDEKQAYFGVNINKKVLVSATLSNKIMDLSYFILNKPEVISNQASKIGVESEPNPIEKGEVSVGQNIDQKINASSDSIIFPAKLEQRYIICSQKRKISLMFALLHWIFHAGNLDTPKKVIVFANSFPCIDFFCVLAPLLTNPYKPSTLESNSEKKLLDGVTINKIHKEMTQLDRSSSFLSFKKAQHSILFCTDVAARGLDFENVSDVIHFDSPLSIETYIHRTGRTARIGNPGTSYLMLYPHEDGYIEYLASKGASVIKRESSVVFYSLVKHISSGTCDLFDCQIEFQKSLDNTVRSEQEIHKAAQEAFHSWRKSYSAYLYEHRIYFDSTQLNLKNISWSFGIRS